MITGDKIVSMELVQPCLKENIKNSTCDLTIGEFFPMGKQSANDARKLNEIWIEPTSMVAVRTTEKIVLPDSVTGLATLVTSLTHEGLLCLNVGVVDPGYDGHLSAFLVNFSRRPRKISLNDRLLRVLFFEHESIEYLEAWQNPKEHYQKFLQAKAENEFASTFLDVAGITELSEKTAWKIVLSALLSRWVAPVSLLIAIVSMIFAALTYFR